MTKVMPPEVFNACVLNCGAETLLQILNRLARLQPLAPILRRLPESSTDTWTSSLERETFWLSDDFMTRITGDTQNGRWRSAPGERIGSAGLLATAAR